MRVLLLEDDEAHATIVETALRLEDPRVELVHLRDGAAALDRLQANASGGEASFDLVLLDLKLPRIDGHEVLRRIKADPLLRAIPVVVLTTSVSGSDLRRAYEHHANSYLVKPVDFQSFQDMIRDLNRYWATWNHRPDDAPSESTAVN